MHNINEGRMMYYGEKPWHGIGKQLDHPATAEEAIKAAGLDYRVDQRELVAQVNGSFKPVPRKHITYRTDKHEPLGIVGDRYQLVQNSEAFSFFDQLVGEGQAIYHTAGALGRGERIWLLAKLPKDLLIFKEDVVEKYLCLTNSHDGTSSLRVYFTPVRVVCQNTLTMSLSDSASGVCVRHTVNLQGKMEEAKRILGLAMDYYGVFDEQASLLASKKLTVKEAEGYFNRVLHLQEDKPSTRSLNVRATLLTLFEKGKGQDLKGIQHSAWAAYNAVTEYVDHCEVAGRKDPSTRLRSIWFGAGAQLKNQAFHEAVKLLK